VNATKRIGAFRSSATILSALVMKGLHENDFIMAAKLDQLASSRRTTGRSTFLTESPTAQLANNKQLTPFTD
jgi:hypothetical protein